MPEQRMTEVVVVQKEGFLVSADVVVADYVRANQNLCTRSLKVLSFHPLAVVTGIGFVWVQPETPAAHELKGMTVMPTFKRLHLGETLVLDREVYQQAVAYFASTDPAHESRQARGLVLEVSTGQGPLLIHLKADFKEAEQDSDQPFLLVGVVPSGRMVTGA